MGNSSASNSDDAPIITIRGEVVGLGPLRRDLLETVHLRWGNVLASGMMRGAAGFATSAPNQRYFDHRTRGSNVEEFLVYELETMRPIGTTNLHNFDVSERPAEMAWNTTEHDFRGEVYGAEPTQLTLDCACTGLGVLRIQAPVLEYNEPLIRLG